MKGREMLTPVSIPGEPGTNFAIDSNFKWMLLVPAVLWLVGSVSYALARRKWCAWAPTAGHLLMLLFALTYWRWLGWM
jgi:CHASE2 domain-containing sensor protein